MGEFGTRLREARESQQLTLAQVEEITRIRRVFLEALEEERFADLPGDVYARGFVRTYAKLLGLDSEELLNVYKAAVGSSSVSIPQVLDEPLLPRSAVNVRAGAFLGLMILVVLTMAAWYAYNRFYLGIDPWPVKVASATMTATSTQAVITQPPTHVVETDTPTRVTATATPPRVTRTVTVSPTVAEPTSSEQETPVQPTNTVPTVQEATATSTMTTKAPETQTPTLTPMPSPTSTLTETSSPTASPTPSPTEVQGIRVEAEVLAKTYVEVTSDGETVLARTLEKGEDQVWTAERELSILIGNAAGLTLTVNGVEIDPLGEEGEVTRVNYTLDNLPEG